MPQTNAPSAARPTNAFIIEHLPDWLKNASRERLAALRASLSAHLDSQKGMAARFQQLVPLDQFAKARLGPAIEAELGVTADLHSAIWREARLRSTRRLFEPLPNVLSPGFELWFSDQPLLQKLLQNFKAGETYRDETVVLGAPPQADGVAQVLTDRIGGLIALCRNIDVGAAYQQHLAQVLNSDFVDALARDQCLALGLAAELAGLRCTLDDNDLNALRQFVQGRQARHAQGWKLVACRLQVLGCPLDGAMAFELREPPRSQSEVTGKLNALKGVIVYLPDAGQCSLRRYADWPAVNAALGEALADERLNHGLMQRVALNDRARYLTLLRKRLSDDVPDLQPAGLRFTGEPFADMARLHVQRIKDDARFLAVPTAQVDRDAAAERLARLKGAGLTLLGLAGLFVPAVGALLLADMAAQLLGEVYEGASDWSQGHQHEALEHMMVVATSVALLGGLAVGVHAARNAFVESLEPVVTEQGNQRLWRNDLSVYRTAPTEVVLTERHDGLFSGDGGLWWHNDGVFYAVRQDARGTWRLLHRQASGNFGPVLRGNGERGWWLSLYNPLEWQGQAHLLARLWPAARAFDAGRVAQILRVADVDEARLRELLVEQRPLPVALRDTLERCAVQAGNTAFFEHSSEGAAFFSRLQWCCETLGLQSLELDDQLASISDNADRLCEPMLEHFAEQYLPDDPALVLVRRHFPTLPKAYAVELLQGASAPMRLTMLNDGRLPLSLAQRARPLLLEARLVRLREALYLGHRYHPDLVRLVFNLLRNQRLAEGQVDLVLRQGSPSGAVLERLWPAFGEQRQALELVWQGNAFQLYDHIGVPSELPVAAPQGLFEVLAATLAPGYRQRLGWTGDDAPERMRAQMQAWLPRERKALLALLGWRDAKPLGAALQRLGDGRLGYPLGPVQSCLESPTCNLRRRVRTLYPTFDEEEVDIYVDLLERRTTSPFSTLLAQEIEYERLDERLRDWSRQGDNLQRERRLLASGEFRRVWRMEGDRFPNRDREGWSTQLSLISIPLVDLPGLPALTDFAHVVNLTLVNLQLTTLPPGFLNNFPRLQVLDLSFNELRRLPTGLDNLSQLRELRLPGNRISLTRAQADVLSGLPELRVLDLSDNAIGSTALPLAELAQLQELNLRRTGLQAVPGGLERCAALVRVDLRNNLIDALPQALLDLPPLRRQVIDLSGNPLAVEQFEHMYRLAPPGQPLSVGAAFPGLKQQWLSTLAEDQRPASEQQWEALRAEPGSDALFELLAEYTASADFRATPEEAGRRVWRVIAAASADERLRQDVFDLAADPRTCADSASHCFSQLEVGVHVSQFTHNGEPAATVRERLQLAQRLFRLHKVEKLARVEMDARYADGRWKLGAHDEEEVEVSLAYRTGLARRLNLLSQPEQMLFGRLARVSQAQLDSVYSEVLSAEASDERAQFISQLDFWVASLRELHQADYALVEDAYQDRWQALEAQGQAQPGSALALGDQAYLQQARALADERAQALAELSLRLTREALQAPV